MGSVCKPTELYVTENEMLMQAGKGVHTGPNQIYRQNLIQHNLNKVRKIKNLPSKRGPILKPGNIHINFKTNTILSFENLL